MQIIYRDKKTVPNINIKILNAGPKHWFKVGDLTVSDIIAGDKLEVKGFYTIENNQSYNMEHVTMATVSPVPLNDDYLINPYTGYDLDTPTKYGMGLVQGWDKVPYNGQNITPNPGQHYDSPLVVQNYVATEDHDTLYFSLWIKLASSAATGSQYALLHDYQTFFEVTHFMGADAQIIYEEDAAPPPPPPPAAWEVTHSVVNTADAGTLTNRGLRVILPASDLSHSGTRIRLTLQAPLVSGHTTYLTSCYIAEKGAGYAPATTPTQIKFGGNAGVTLPYGAADVVSDETNFTLDETKDYVIYFGNGSSVGYGARTDFGLTNAYHKSNAGGDGLNMSPSGYTHDVSCGSYLIKKLEVA